MTDLIEGAWWLPTDPVPPVVPPAVATDKREAPKATKGCIPT